MSKNCTQKAPVSLVPLSAVMALIAALLAPFFAPLFVVKAQSGYSGHPFWLRFYSAPTEKEIFDAVCSREPALAFGPNEQADLQKVKETFKAGFPHGDICLAPYSPNDSPDVLFQDGTRIKGVWITEPSTRVEYDRWVGILISSITIGIVAFLAMFAGLKILRWTWYFVLDRLSELSRALRPRN
jgi:hypothetical protein